MARLRRKLDPDRTGLQYIVTEAGVGYRLLEAQALSVSASVWRVAEFAGG